MSQISSHPLNVIRHAFILVLEYKQNNHKTYVDSPAPLLAMNVDLANAYRMATDCFRIPRNNVTVVTDVIPPPGIENPWGVFRQDGENPRVVRLEYPDITAIVREIAQFIENTVRGIEDLAVLKGEDEEQIHELFIYISCHGAQIGREVDSDGEITEYDNALVFQKSLNETTIVRRYLRDENLFDLLFGNIYVKETGFMTVPTIQRRYVRGSENYTLEYSDAEDCSFYLTPTRSFNGLSTRETYISGRGMPSNTRMICVIDTCHSGTLADFHYIYDPQTEKMRQTDRIPSHQPFPICVSFAASADTSEAISTPSGSPFTKSLLTMFSQARCAMSIKQFHKALYASIPRIVAAKRPTITATVDNPDQIIPFLTHLPQCSNELCQVEEPPSPPKKPVGPRRIKYGMSLKSNEVAIFRLDAHSS